MSISIDWSNFKNNIQSQELSFESFVNQIIRNKYSDYGFIEDYYNTPGSEIYLTLYKDCDALNLKKGDIVGWQVKFWLNHSDHDNSKLDAGHRDELVANFKKTLEYKPDIKKWIICTPGKFSNTKTSSGRPFDILKSELTKVKNDIILDHWHKEVFEKFYHDSPCELSPIISHYFGSKFIGTQTINNYTKVKIKYLHEKFDSDLYVRNELDKKIFSLIKYSENLELIKRKSKIFKHEIKTIEADELYNFNEFKRFNSDYIEKAKKLLHNRILTAKYVIGYIKDVGYLNIDITNKIILKIEEDEKNNNKLISELNKLLKKKKNVVEIDRADYDFREDRAHDFYIESINFIGSELFKSKNDNKKDEDKIIDVLEKFSCNLVSVFGDAGDGKTNLACSIGKDLVDDNLPALLILGSELNGDRDIKDQIMSLFDIPRDMTFRDFLGSLNNLGFAHRIRIPIIIDGLNETCPTAHIWKKGIAELEGIISEFENIILVTTCRDRYLQQVYGVDSYRDVENSLHLSGFTKYNIDEVIDKYFNKYKVRVRNPNFDKNLLQKPIILKIFSKINEGKEVLVTPFNLYNAIEEYFNLCIKRISTKNGVIDPVLEREINERLTNFSKKIWDDNVRSIKYPEELLKIFDPSYLPERDDFSNTISNKIINEGIFISRKPENKNEYIEFSYDLLGGYYIAKTVFFNDKNSIKTIKDSLGKLINEDQEKNHPLSEDIIRAISYLLPQNTGEQIFEVVDNEKIIHDSITMIDLITDTNEGKKAFSNTISKINIDSNNIDYLIDTLISKIIENDDISNIDLLVDTLLRMTNFQIDLKWSEILRKRKSDLLRYLHKKVKNTDTQGEINKEIMSFIALVGTTPDQYLRDVSTKALVKLGEKEPRELFVCLKELIGFKDLFVIERLMAAIFGVIVSIDKKDLLLEICDYIEGDLFKKLKTNHFLILDYSYLILKYAEKNYKRKANIKNLYSCKDEVWEEDEECRKKIDGDGKATWGYYPIDMDFAKYKIGFVASREHYVEEGLKTPTLKECLAMVIWKMKSNGYQEEKIKILQRKIAEEAKEKRIQIRIDYGEKYALIAFHELCGYFIVNKLMPPEYGYGFRHTNLNIDPIFPAPPKRQIDLKSYSPERKEDAKKWVNENIKYYENFYNYEFENSAWILLNARLTQDNSEVDTRMHAYLNTYFVEKDRYLEFENYVKDGQKGIISFDASLPERYYLYLGESSWSDNVPDGREKYTVNKSELEICNSCFDYVCEGHRSEINSFSNLTLLCKYIFDELKLKFSPNELSYLKDGIEVVKYVYDDYAHYVFINKGLLLSFLKKNNYMLMFYEYGSRYAKWKSIEKEGEDSNFKDFRNISWLEIDND